jgi:hypothetical protein
VTYKNYGCEVEVLGAGAPKTGERLSWHAETAGPHPPFNPRQNILIIPAD